MPSIFSKSCALRIFDSITSKYSAAHFRDQGSGVTYLESVLAVECGISVFISYLMASVVM